MGRPRGNGLFLPLSVGFMGDEKIVEVSLKAAWLYLSMSLMAKERNSDGVLSHGQIAELGQAKKLKGTKWETLLDELLEGKGVGPGKEPLVVKLPLSAGFYVLPAFAKHNELKGEQEDRLTREREAKKRPKPSSSEEPAK